MSAANTEAENAVSCWRGHCLNYFGRVESAVGNTLQAAVTVGKAEKLRHLAGQRLADLIAVVGDLGGTLRQQAAFKAALSRWEEVEGKRQFLAHGVACVSTTSNGDWVALFDLTIYRGNAASSGRWAVKQTEAEQFLIDLADAFKSLSGQLGHVRKRLEA